MGSSWPRLIVKHFLARLYSIGEHCCNRLQLNSDRQGPQHLMNTGLAKKLPILCSCLLITQWKCGQETSCASHTLWHHVSIALGEGPQTELLQLHTPCHQDQGYLSQLQSSRAFSHQSALLQSRTAAACLPEFSARPHQINMSVVHSMHQF